MPSWLGDAVMATPAARLIRAHLPGAYIGALVRPGVDELLAGLDLFDELHVERAAGVMGPKFGAAKVRPRRYQTALLLTNSFSTALITRLAGIPRRIGYSRDARGVLLTERLEAPRRPDGSWAPVPAVSYYWRLAQRLLGLPERPDFSRLPPAARMELAVTPRQEAAGRELLARAGVETGRAYAVLNPGGNNPAKRWPPERYAMLADHLAERHGLRVLISGSPAEADLAATIARLSRSGPAQLPPLGIAIGSLKAAIRGSRLMVTNDTGPRHIAAAFGVPVVSLFGPTDHRWTTIPAPGGESLLLADPTLPEDDIADDHPDRCRIDRIPFEAVRDAAERLLTPAG